MSGIDRHLKALLHRQPGMSNRPKAIEEIMSLSDYTKNILYHILNEAEMASRTNRNRRRW